MEHRLHKPLKKRLKELKITLTQFYEMVGFKPARFNNWLYGSVPMPKSVEKEVEEFINSETVTTVRIVKDLEIIAEFSCKNLEIKRDICNYNLYLKDK